MLNPETNRCPFCLMPATPVSSGNFDGAIFDCFRCGRIKVTGTALAVANAQRDESSESRWLLSSSLSENQGLMVTSLNLGSLIPQRRPSVSDRAEKLLRALARLQPIAGRAIKIEYGNAGNILRELETPRDGRWNDLGLKWAKTHLPLMAAAWAESEDQFQFLLEDVLVASKHWLRSLGDWHYVISANGWEFLEGVVANADSRDGFVAMSFDSELDEFYAQVIAPAIEANGFLPKRVDRTEHVNRIDDEIVAGIRRSRFIVADFTHHKNGVYFEAGFAMGIGIPVIWVCRESDLPSSHFDTRQYNAVKWNEDELEDARNRLEIRIRAVVGEAKLPAKLPS